MHLYLLRHAEDRAGKHGPQHGSLTDRGRHQAAAAARLLAGHRPTGLRTSTLPRALETARAVAEHTGLTAREDARLNEIVWRSPDGGPLPHPREHRCLPPPPGGESWRTFLTRVAVCMSELCRRATEEQRIVLVTHSGFFDAVHELLCGGGSTVELLVAHAGITHWQYRPGDPGGPWLLHQHNVTAGPPPVPARAPHTTGMSLTGTEPRA